MITFSGPLGPKFIADAFVASENVGEGGPGETARLGGDIARERRERARGIVGQSLTVLRFEVCNLRCGVWTAYIRSCCMRLYISRRLAWQGRRRVTEF